MDGFMPRVLFVCTGNMFRSVAAEYLLRAAFGAEPRWRIESAGTQARSQDSASSLVREALTAYRIDASAHRTRALTGVLLGEVDFVIAMGTDHKEFIARQFRRRVPLFNELCHGRATGVLDIHEALHDWTTNTEATRAHVEATVAHLHASMPRLVRVLDDYGARVWPGPS
jgi:protein-tyrosine phosphatase